MASRAPKSNKEDERQRQICMQILCQDVADLAPSVYALQLACRRLRQNYIFSPEIAEVLGEMKKAKQQAKRLKTLEARLARLQKVLAEYEHDLPRLTEEHATGKKAWAAEQQRERTRLQQQLADMRTPPSQYSNRDLKLLSITREELMRRYRAELDKWKCSLAARPVPRAKRTKGAEPRTRKMPMPKGWKVHGDES